MKDNKQKENSNKELECEEQKDKELRIESLDIYDDDEIMSPEGMAAFECNESDDIIERAKDKAKKKVNENKNKFSTRIKYILDAFMTKPFKSSLLLSFIMLMFIESMSRRSLGGAVSFACESPVIFILNWLMVLAPFLLSIAVKRKPIVYLLSIILWSVLGIVDFYMLSFRTTPFTGVDLQISMNEVSVAMGYLGSSGVRIILSFIIIILVFVIVCIFCPKSKINMKRWKAIVCVVIGWLFIYGIIIGSVATGILSTKFGNLGIAYHDYGIAYCFTVTVVDTGISKPDDYSEQKIYELITNEDKDKKKNSELPNVIFIQLESLIDVSEIKGLKLSDDATPTLRKLRKKYSSGYLTMPTIVAGTCNTEFEMITGMSLEFFGPGEYPYKTILRETTCESAAFDLKKLGFTAHGIHNHTSGFYGRNEVYANMGFDTFTGVEMMHDTIKTPNGKWTRDNVLTGCIMDCLTSTKGKDYVYTVTVQPHGMYNVDLSEEDKHIEVHAAPGKPEMVQQYEYYVNQIKETDNFIKELIKELEDYDEDVMLVMYGDHIPGLGLSDDSFTTKRNIYQTEYVIWDNFGLKKKNKDYMAYELTAEALKRAGIKEGTIFKYHQQVDHKSEDYLKNLEQLQYDMLYGDHYAYNGMDPFEKTDIVYGPKDILIDKVSCDGEYVYIEGGYFNTYSKVFVNGKKYEEDDIELLSSTLLKVKVKQGMLKKKNVIQIKNINSLDVEFKATKEYKYKYTGKIDETPIDDSDVGNISKDEA